MLKDGSVRLYPKQGALIRRLGDDGEAKYYYAYIKGDPPKYILTDDRGPYYSVGENENLQGVVFDLADFEFCHFQGYLESADREVGLYRSRTGVSEARLSYAQRYKDKPAEPWVDISTTDARDGVLLLHELREGTINPVASYAKPQADTPEICLWRRLVLAIWPERPAKYPRKKRTTFRRTKKLSPKLNRMFRCQVPDCGAVHHGSELTRNCGILLACPEPGCLGAVKPMSDDKTNGGK